MKSILLPGTLMLFGIGSGTAAGFFLAPEPDLEEAKATQDCAAPEATNQPSVAAVADAGEEREFAKLNNQFIIPVVEDGIVASLVVMSLNLEVTVGSRTAVFAVEPKLRDRFLQVMFDHANTGGFSGNFTSGTKMRILRDDLLRVAQEVSGTRVTDVLVIDIVRQDA